MSIEQDNAKRSAHQISMHARESMEVRGVTDVVSFDEQSVILDTVCGGVSVEGEALHVRVLNIEQGIVTMDGRIDSIYYYDNSHAKDEKKGFLGRLKR